MAKSIGEYFVGQSGGYGGGAMAGGQVAPTNWAGTFSSNQTSRRLDDYPASRRYTYMQGNTVIGSSLYDTITKDDLKDPRFGEDEIFAGLRWEMRKMEYPSKDVARPIVISNLEKNPKYYSELKKAGIQKHIVKKGSKYCLMSKKTNKNLGCYPTKAGAKKREKQVQYFKHAK